MLGSWIVNARQHVPVDLERADVAATGRVGCARTRPGAGTVTVRLPGGW
jgi:hypothetical protein